MYCRKSCSAVLSSLIITTTLLIAAPSYGADSLGSYKINLSETSVSGLSSGAFMADQFHIAFSSIVMGAGLIAGGPYNCAQGSLMKALQKCMKTGGFYGTPDGKALENAAQKYAKEGEIDDLSNLKDNKVYIFHGMNDTVVAKEVSDQTRVFYQATGLEASNIKQVQDIPAGHAFVTTDYGNVCDTKASFPYISHCKLDQAGDLLNHIYAGTLKKPASPLSGKIVTFEQNEFIKDPNLHSMDKVGYAYIPKSCDEGTECRVHIAFHGCSQGASILGEDYVKNTGYNPWADQNNMIVLYPQATSNTFSGNPNGCWDFWGYDGKNYYTQKGTQLAAVKKMLDRLATPQSNNTQ